MKSKPTRTIGALVLAAAFMLGCPSENNGGNNGGNSTEAMPDFALVDVNPTSARSGQTISPRDYLDQVSAWYFGHST